MIGKYKVITLCGSTRFKEQFLEAQKRSTRGEIEYARRNGKEIIYQENT
jgi:hypothetical protein